MADTPNLTSKQFKHSSEIRRMLRKSSDMPSITDSDIKRYKAIAESLNKTLRDSLTKQQQLKKEVAAGNEKAAEQLTIQREYARNLQGSIEHYKELASAQEHINELERLREKRIQKRIEDIQSEVKFVHAGAIQEFNYNIQRIKDEKKLFDAKKAFFDLEETSYTATRRSLKQEIELNEQILSSQVATDEEKRQALEDVIKQQKELNDLEERREKRTSEASMRIYAANQVSEEKEKEGPVSKIGTLFSDMKSAFAINKDAGMSPIKAILSVKDTIKEGNSKSTQTLEKLGGILTSGFNSMNAMIDNAARVVEAGYGSVTAAIDGTGKTFEDIRENFLGGIKQPGVGISTLVKQEDLLKEVTNLARDGISTDLESISILSTIRDKTVASFQVTDGNLRRLIRLNQNLGNLTAKQFGLAAVLRTELNAAFGDSSYIGRMFQQLTGTLLDAVSANALKGSTDSTNFYAVMETFAAGMYEAGVDEGTVSSIAQGLNYLGSGNINALSGNKTLQNLLLLSMDRVGMDYATILQQGLTTEDTADLLQSIIDYLAQITEQNSKNNVLQSSYANLFNLSITDMAAIRNLAKNNTFMSMARNSVNQDNNYAMSMAIEELNQVSNRTIFSEKMNNVFENLKFTMGSGVASSKWAYPTNLISRLGVQAGQMMQDVGMTIAGKVTKIASGIGYAISLLGGVDDVLAGLGAGINSINNGSTNTLSNYFTTTFSDNGGIYDLGMMPSSVEYSKQGSGSFKGFDDGGDYEQRTKQKEVYKESEKWEQEQKESEEDPNTKILKEFEKTLMKANEGDGYAFAVSLQGMSDGVLRSFASIFADEDAMMETLTGKNNALEQNNTFIDYVTDTSSKRSANSSSSTNSSKSGNVSNATANAVRAANR